VNKEQAIDLYESKWWENRSDRDIVGFQLFEPLLCIPFELFHKKVEKVLGRPVFTHEFGLNYDGLKAEFLGVGERLSLDDILNMISEEKRIVIVAERKAEGGMGMAMRRTDHNCK